MKQVVIEAAMEKKCRPPCKRALKYVSGTGVKKDLAFCLRPFIEKTNSGPFKDPSPVSVSFCWKQYCPALGEDVPRTVKKSGPNLCTLL